MQKRDETIKYVVINVVYEDIFLQSIIFSSRFIVLDSDPDAAFLHGTVVHDGGSPARLVGDPDLAAGLYGD